MSGNLIPDPLGLGRHTYHACLSAYLASKKTFAAMPIEDEGSDVYCEVHYQLWDAVLQAPAPSVAVILDKMAMLEERYLDDCEAVPEVDWVALKRDIANLLDSQSGSRPPAQSCDASLIAAWNHWSDWRAKVAMGEVQDDRLSQSVIEASEILVRTLPQTIEGAAKKLRFFLWTEISESGELAVIGQDDPAHLQAEVEGNMEQALWTAIQGLEAMGAGRAAA